MTFRDWLADEKCDGIDKLVKREFMERYDEVPDDLREVARMAGRLFDGLLLSMAVLLIEEFARTHGLSFVELEAITQNANAFERGVFHTAR